MPLLRARGHEIFTPTYAGLGERAHQAVPGIGLQTHVEDVLGVLTFEDLGDVVLVGHSYGGMVATVVADRAPERLRHLVYLDAFVPRDGQSLGDLLPAEMRTRMLEAARAQGNGWRIPPNPVPPDTSEADVAWITPRVMRRAGRSTSRRGSPALARTCLARTSTAHASHRSTSSGRSPSARGANPAGSTSSSTPATAPTSPPPTRWRRCSTRSRPGPDPLGAPAALRASLA